MKKAASVLLLAWVLAPSLAFPQAPAAVPPAFLQPERGFAELGSLAEPLDAARLRRAALLASGVTPERLATYEARLDSVLEELGAELAGMAETATPSATTVANAITIAKAEAVLSFLHKGTLRAYREDATTLDGILDSGIYNCVSSAILYAIAARSVGIAASAVRTQDHAFCRVSIGDRGYDVETTNPYGFDPGNKKEFKDSFGRATGYAYVAPGGYGDRREIGAGELAGLILSNRSSMLERQGRYAEATRLGADYAAICPGPDSRSFLVDRVNNLVAGLESRRDFAGAEAAARAALAAMPGEAKLAALARMASYNKAVALGQAGDWAAAFDASVLVAADRGGRDAEASSLVASSLQGLALLYARSGDFALSRAAVAERAVRAGPEATAAAYAVVGEMELVRAANELPFAQAEATADRIFAAGEVSRARYAQALGAIYGNEAARMGSSGDYLGGAALAERGAAKLQGDRSLARLAADLRHNFVAEAHNRFARLYNGGDYKGAAAVLESALLALPGDATLAKDLKAAEAALAPRTREPTGGN
jgi:hypothetical protein